MTDPLQLALIGHPLSHSLSPVLHKAALNYAGLSGDYRLIDIAPENFQAQLKNSMSKELRGFNVTVPYKEVIYSLLSNESKEAKITEAVNTIRVESDGRFSGHNTDLLGFRKSISESFDLDLRGKQAFVIGAGGSAKAIVIGLAQMGVSKITIKTRDPSKANLFIAKIKSNLARSFKDRAAIPEFLCCEQNDFSDLSQPQALVINTSPIGLRDETAPEWFDILLKHLPSDCVFFDLVYRKDKSKPILAQTAINNRFAAVDGLSMLAHQAKFSFEYWTGVDVPAAIFLESLGIQTNG